MTVFLPNCLNVASLRDAGKEGVSIPHTAKPIGFLYGVSSRRCCISAKKTSFLCARLPQRY